MTRRFSAWRALTLSFFSHHLYRDVCFNWKGFGARYLFLLISLTWLAHAVFLHNTLHDFTANQTTSLTNQLQSSATTHILRDTRTQQPLIIIDTTGAITHLNQMPTARLLITKHNISIRTQHSNIETFALNSISHTLSIHSARFLKVALWALTPFVVCGLFIVGLMALLALGLVGMLIARLFNAQLTYNSLLRLSAVALTPGLLAKSILILLPNTSLLAGTDVLIITLIYLCAAVHFCKPYTTAQ